MIFRWFLYILALGLPWLIFLIKDNPGAAFVAFLMQATVIGWLPATIWAIRTVSADKPVKKKHKAATEKSK